MVWMMVEAEFSQYDIGGTTGGVSSNLDGNTELARDKAEGSLAPSLVIAQK